MSSSELPIGAFPAWALFNNLEFTHVRLQDVQGKGLGLLVEDGLVANAGGNETLLSIPRDLVLSADAVEEYAKVDQNFRQLLDAVGHQTTRGDVLLYLLAHLVQPRRARSGPARAITPSAWTEYLKFLPRSIPTPTMWSDAERNLLQGTSLETALGAKLASLAGEFDALRDKSSDLPFWNQYFWEEESATLADWVLVDAWWRSRCLELPTLGEVMVPGLDMVNHSSNASAYYEEEQDAISLRKRPTSTLSLNEEVTISYGDAKSAAEMLFSYGFVDQVGTKHQDMTLPLTPMSDDPLGKAKLHIFDGPPCVKVLHREGFADWESPFAFLLCLNEEDGLEFRVLQDVAGERQLKLFWQEEDVTAKSNQFESLIQSHPLAQLFKLRTVAMLLERITMQLERISSAPSRADVEMLIEMGVLRSECVQAADALRQVETSMLSEAARVLEHQKNELLEDEHVVAYLGSMEEHPKEESPKASSNQDEDDFS